MNTFTLFPIACGVSYAYVFNFVKPDDAKSCVEFTLVSLVVACVLSYSVHVARHVLLSKILRVRPPGPIPMPLIGSLLMLIKRNGPDGNPRIHTGLADVAKKYDKENKGIVGLWMGSYYVTVITKPNLAHEAFVQKGKFTSDRAPMQSHGGHHVPSMYIATRDGKGIAMSTGDYWRKVRGVRA